MNAVHHAGVDLAVHGQPGGEVRAIGPGTVVNKLTGYGAGWGNAVLIKHDLYDGVFYSLYGHMEDNSVTVKIGHPVNAGQAIGKVGNTGFSEGAHLHFAVLLRNDFGCGYLDPDGKCRRCSIRPPNATKRIHCEMDADCSGFGICDNFDNLSNYLNPLDFVEKHINVVASISGEVYNDYNGDGAYQAGEPPLSDWQVMLLQGSTTVARTQTDVDGKYSFSPFKKLAQRAK